MRKYDYEKNVQNYCCEDISKVENFEAAKKDNFKGWCCHHRLETHNSDGERRLVDIRYRELVALGMYYNRPAQELIFLRADEHRSLHTRGKPKPEEWRRKHSEAMKGKGGPKGRHWNLSDETRKKMSNAKKGKPNLYFKCRHWKIVDGKRVWY